MTNRYINTQKEYRFDDPHDRARFTQAWATHYNETYRSSDTKLAPVRALLCTILFFSSGLGFTLTFDGATRLITSNSGE